MSIDMEQTRRGRYAELLFLAALIGVWTNMASASYEAEKRLFQEIFDPVDKRVRPAGNWSVPVVVEVEFAPVYFKGINEPLQLFELYTWIAVHWRDPRLTWQAQDYDEIEFVTLPADKLWMPDIGVINSAIHLYSPVFEPEHYRAIVYNDGTIRVVFAGTIQTICVLDVTLFPFDEQLCHVEIDSWSLPKSGMKFSDKSFLTLKKLRQNGEWIILDSWLVFHEENYRGQIYRTLSFVFKIDRKPLYVLYNVILPCVLLFFLELLVFCIPPEAGEKISLGITLMLSLTVFQLVIQSYMPITSDYFPLFSMYITIIMLLSAVTLTFTVLIISIHHRDPSRPLPAWVSKLVLVCLARVMCVSVPKKKPKLAFYQHNNGHDIIKSPSDVGSEAAFLGRNSETVSPSSEPSDGEWILVARVLDRLFLLVFMLVALAVTIAVYWACLKGGTSRTKPIGGFGYDIDPNGIFKVGGITERGRWLPNGTSVVP